jgi:hypothetical protein
MSIQSHTSKQLVDLIDQRDAVTARRANSVPLAQMDSVSAALIEASLSESGYEVRYPNLRRVTGADAAADVEQTSTNSTNSTAATEGTRRRRLVLFGVRRHG